MQRIVLTIVDRVIIGSMLPEKGGKIKMMLAKSIADAVNFSPDEITTLELKDGGDGLITWNPEKGRFADRHFDISPEQVQVLKECIAEADEMELITRQMLPLIDKIDAL